MLIKFIADLFVLRLFLGEFQCHFQHAEAVKRHPSRAIGLLENASVGNGGAAIEDSDIVQPQEASFEDIVAKGVFAIDPPSKVEHKFLEDAL